MKNRVSTIILAVIFCAGLSLLLYPTVSNYWNSFHQSKAISSYVESVENLDEAQYEEIWNDAVNYNKKLAGKYFNLSLSDEEKAEYENLLDIAGTGIMGYIEIPKIKCTLPIYHGTEESILQVAVGHIGGTSLPVGGESSHCVLSGHRGLPSAKLFTDIDRLVEGDQFMIRVLDEVLTYEVDQILIVLPEETDALKIENGKDLCTLVTCTPYGINTHRLLVRGHRVATTNSLQAFIIADAVRIEPLEVAPLVAAPILLFLLIRLLVTTGKKKKR